MLKVYWCLFKQVTDDAVAKGCTCTFGTAANDNQPGLKNIQCEVAAVHFAFLKE